MREIEEKLNLLDIQIMGTILFIVSLFVSILLNVNQRKYTLHQKPLFSAKTTYLISNFNRLLVLAIALSFLYTSYEFKKIAKEKGSNVALNDLDVFASTLTVVGAIIVLYITANSPVENALDIENPNI